MIKTTISILTLSTILGADCLLQPTEVQIGLCYEKEDNKILAQAAYERALFKDENSVEAQIRLAALYKSMHMDEEASAILKHVEQKQLTPAQRTSLAAVKTSKKQTLNVLNLRANMYLGYDSNVNVSPSIKIIQDNNTTTDSVQSSLFTRLRADLSYLHDLGSSGGWYLRSDINFFYQNNSSAHYYDVTYARAYAGGGYRNNSFTFYIPLFYDRIHYLDYNLFQEYGILPDLTLSIIDGFFLNLNANYTKRNYIKDIDFTRNDTMISGGVGLFLLDTNYMLYSKFRYENYQASHNNPAPFTNNRQLYAMLGCIYSLSEQADIELHYQYRYGDYAKVLSLKRDDSNNDASIILKYNITHGLRINGDYRYVNNRSSYQLAEYTKHEFMLGLEYNY